MVIAARKLCLARNNKLQALATGVGVRWGGGAMHELNEAQVIKSSFLQAPTPSGGGKVLMQHENHALQRVTHLCEG